MKHGFLSIFQLPYGGFLARRRALASVLSMIWTSVPTGVTADHGCQVGDDLLQALLAVSTVSGYGGFLPTLDALAVGSRSGQFGFGSLFLGFPADLGSGVECVKARPAKSKGRRKQ